MTDIKVYMKQQLLIDKINDYLHDICGYGYKDRLETGKGKPELVFQSKIQEFLEDDYKVERSYPVDTDKLAIRQTLNETDWEIDLKITNKDVTCYVEVKYDELKKDGSSTNPQSEDEILRDIYKLQCVKRTYPNASCLIVFATNNPKHWKDFLQVNAQKYSMSYNGDEENFKIIYSYNIEWKESLMFEDEGYKYFILNV